MSDASQAKTFEGIQLYLYSGIILHAVHTAAKSKEASSETMNSLELEELANFLRNNDINDVGKLHGSALRSKSKAFWESYSTKASLSLAVFSASIIFFRTFGSALI